MTDQFECFQQIAPRVAENGYEVIPLPRGKKRAAIEKWQKFEFAPAHADSPKHSQGGTGILTRNTPAVDIDVRDAELAQRLDALTVETLGPGPRRVGSAPKCMRIYRLEGDSFTKLKTRGFHLPGDSPDAKPHCVEILADGQQFVAFNIHPETHKPYLWNGEGSPLTVPHDRLPPISLAKAKELIAAADAILAKHGTPVGRLLELDDEREHKLSERGMRATNPAACREALRAIPSEETSYEEWIHVGAALHGALGPEGLDAWLEWSSRHPTYDREKAEKKWQTFGDKQGSGAGTIFHLARLYGWERPKPSDEWAPPQVMSYGEGFDPAKIPPRRWLLGRRRAVGELTVDAGPPGVNKSTLMLTDAVAISTGRKLLADDVHAVGEVLYLAGEDARRDVEARLAGILAHHHIKPAELGGRLHVVYLGEIDTTAYTLANMARDVATLNSSMLGWLRTYPNLIAVFVDPIAAWHQLMENSNESLQLLCSSLRGVAVQGMRHVGLDHHVNKVSMVDVEAHVGNLSALRGASSLIANARWAFTLARLKPETAEAVGIVDEAARKRLRRLDPLKASYGRDDEEMRLLRVESVPIANGEEVGVLVEVDMRRVLEDAVEQRASEAQTKQYRITEALAEMLRQARPRTASQAAVWLLTHHPQLFRGRSGEPLSDDRLRKQLPVIIGPGLVTTHDGKPAKIVALEPEKVGQGRKIDFAPGDF
jgi:hypothetical protein